MVNGPESNLRDVAAVAGMLLSDTRSERPSERSRETWLPSFLPAAPTYFRGGQAGHRSGQAALARGNVRLQ